MTKVIVAQDVRSRLNGLGSQLELCDEAGNTLGHFVPPGLYKEMLAAWLNAQVTDEELERVSREPGGRPLADIWKSLGRT